jgi:hypothetical protein
MVLDVRDSTNKRLKREVKKGDRPSTSFSNENYVRVEVQRGGSHESKKGDQSYQCNQVLTLLLQKRSAPLSNNNRMTCSEPPRQALWSGVKPC